MAVGRLSTLTPGSVLGNSPGNVGVEAAPFKFTAEYLEVLGGIDGAPYTEFKDLFHEGFEAARKHCDRLICTFVDSFGARTDRSVAIVELMQKGMSCCRFAKPGE